MPRSGRGRTEQVHACDPAALGQQLRAAPGHGPRGHGCFPVRSALVRQPASPRRGVRSDAFGHATIIVARLESEPTPKKSARYPALAQATIAVLPGDGVGEEITRAALTVL